MNQQGFQPLKQYFAPPKATMLRRILYFFARPIYAMSLQRQYQIHHVNAEFLRTLEAPYVLLGNHVTNDDPFLCNILCPYPIAWIIGKSIERDSRFPWLLRTIRCISRSKETSDWESIKKIRQWITEGEVVGIFPEGQTSCSGVSQPIPATTAKLLRLLKVPVVVMRNKGGYFVHPRWARKRRVTGKSGPGIALHYELLFDRKQIQTAKLGEIQQKLEQALYENPYQHRNAEDSIYPPPRLDLGLKWQNLAESMELVFYACLSCRSAQSLGTMQSQNMELRCGHCAAVWRISDDSHFLRCGTLHFDLDQYYRGQLELLDQLATQGLLQLNQTFARLRGYSEEDEAFRLRQGGSIRRKNGHIALNREGLVFVQKGQQTLNFPVNAIFGSHVFKHNIWELRAHNNGNPETQNQAQQNVQPGKNTLFVLEFPHKTDSAFLLLDSLKALQKHEKHDSQPK